MGCKAVLATPRGAVSNRPRATQARDFTGLRYGNITPTDSDGWIEYHDKCYVFYEAKHTSAQPMTTGQKLAFERLCDDLQKVKPVIYILFEHSFPVEQAIDFAICKVESYRFMGEWRKPKQEMTVKGLSDRFIERYGK